MRDLGDTSGGTSQLDTGEAKATPPALGPCRPRNPPLCFSQSLEAPSQHKQLFPVQGQALNPQHSQSQHLLLIFELCQAVTHWFC